MNNSEKDTTTLMLDFARTQSACAFTALVERYLPMVFRAAVRSTGDLALAEDVCQLVFIDFAKRIPTLRADERIGLWLHRAATLRAGDLIKSERRRRRREQTASSMMELEQLPDPADLLWQELSPTLDEALNRCRSEDREILVLHYLEGRKLRNIAEHLGISEEAARKRNTRAVERLRSKLKVGSVGITAVGAALLTNAASGAVPANLCSQITTAAMSKLATGGVSAWFLRHSFGIRTAGIGAAIALVCGIFPVWNQWHELQTLRAANAAVGNAATAESQRSLALKPSNSTSLHNVLTTPEILARLAEILSHPLSSLDAERCKVLFAKIPESEYAEVLETMDRTWTPALLRNAQKWRQEYCIKWAGNDAPAALAWLLQRLQCGSAEFLRRADWQGSFYIVMSAWASRDWDSAWKWVRDGTVDGTLLLGDKRMDIPSKLVAALGSQLVQREGLQSAIDFFADLQSRGGATNAGSGALRGLISAVKEDAEFRYFLDASGRLSSPENRVMLKQELVKRWAELNRPSALRWLQEISDAEERAKFGWDLGFEKDGAHATEYADWLLEQNPTPTTKVSRDALEAILYGWMTNDPVAACDWLIAHKSLNTIDLSTLLTSLEYKCKHPSAEASGAKLLRYWNELNANEVARQLKNMQNSKSLLEALQKLDIK